MIRPQIMRSLEPAKPPARLELSSGEAGGPLCQKGVDPFAKVFAGITSGDEVLGLPWLEAAGFLNPQHHLLGRPDRKGSVGGEGFCQLPHDAVQLRWIGN